MFHNWYILFNVNCFSFYINEEKTGFSKVLTFRLYNKSSREMKLKFLVKEIFMIETRLRCFDFVHNRSDYCA